MTGLINPARRGLGETSIGPLALGCWRLVGMSVRDAQACYVAAIESGMNLVDTADVYGLDWGGTGFGHAEALLGEVLSGAPELRAQMVLATKGGIIPGVPYDSGYLADACEASLQRLQVEQVDLYQIHRPDILAHPQETARVLEDLLTAGKIRMVGVSNYAPHQTAALMEFLPGKIVSQQPEYSALHLVPLFDGCFDQCMQHGMAVLAWSPLGGGRLADSTDLPGELAQVLEGLAQREGVDVPTIALAFTLAHPAQPVAIVGSTAPARIRAAQRALQVTLAREDVYAIIQTSMGESLP